MVTPFAGVWIEIPCAWEPPVTAASLPSRECGLKFDMSIHLSPSLYVTPFAGVWIEIPCACEPPVTAARHSLRGSVD